MTRSLQQLKQPAHQADHAPDQDSLEAEHDPAVSRRASLADLRRHNPANEGPSEAQAESALIHAVQAHAKLTAARMHAAAANIRDLLQTDTSGPAGTGPMEQAILAQIAMVNNDLDALEIEMRRVPDLLRGTLTPELNAIYGAFHESWAPALNRVYSALDMEGLVTEARTKMQGVLRVVGKEEADMTAVLAPRRNRENLAEQRDEELMAAELEALKSGMSSVELALELVKANLGGSGADLSHEALLLDTAVLQLADMFEPISADHIGKIAKMPILIKKLRALRAEIEPRRGNNKADRAVDILGGHTFKTSIDRLDAKIAQVQSVQNWNKKNRR